jgi:hypothetical protein
LEAAKIQMSNRVYYFSPAVIPSEHISRHPCKFQRLKKLDPPERPEHVKRKENWTEKLIGVNETFAYRNL